VFGRTEIAEDFLRNHLPADIAALIPPAVCLSADVTQHTLRVKAITPLRAFVGATNSQAIY
jgi:hypothetical protein